MANNFEMNNKVGQVTIFIILAILIVGIVVVFFVAKERGIFQASVPQELEPVYNYYLSCIEEQVSEGALILGGQGGYINSPEFEAGSEYMPFSSQLSFFGIGIPYWYYISGNGIVKEQIPSKAKMQSQLNNYVSEGMVLCDFSEFEEQGFEISFEGVEIESVIRDNEILVDVEQNLVISFGDVSWKGKSHSVKVNSLVGKFYDLAQEIYLNQKGNMFLENYGVDVLRLYAPVDGTEIGCSPIVWNVDDIRFELINALEANVPMIKVKGDYYSLKSEENKYFEVDIGKDVDVDVNFMYSGDWPMKLEVWPSEDGILIAEPVGLQEGLGMLGFCYTSYHFVYDFAYPVLIQLYSGSEMFQFPVVVSIDKNMPRKALNVEGLPDVVPELCENKLNEISVSVVNTNSEPIDSFIKFKCFDTICNIGEAEGGELTADFPQCVNGFVLASAEGYKTGKYQVENINENNAFIVLDKKYNLDLEVQKDGRVLTNEYAVVNFVGEDTITVAYPEQKKIELSAGQYEVKVYVYSNSSIKLEGSSTQKCVDVPKSGVFGMFGATEEKCFDFEVPDQIVSFAVSGGGTQNYYVTESELESEKVIVNSRGFGIPTKVEDLQTNYNNIEINGLEILFG